jgi:hypothetical protein
VVKSITNGVTQDPLLRCRYEMKYIISQSKAAAIARFIEPYISPDRYTKSQPTGYYPIVSLYLDSDTLQLCKESVGGILKRFKLRIRSYTDDPDYPRFFEVKRRSNTVILKSRARVATEDVPILLSGRYVPPVQNYQEDIDALRQFQLYMRSVGAKPVILVRYLRRAYEGNTENRVRVTFDRQLTYKLCSDHNVLLSGNGNGNGNGNGWQHNPVTLQNVILEIKFTGCYPAWLARMTRCFDLQQQSMSKYATSVKKACSLRFSAPLAPIMVD